jgi:hypothetical protein
LASTTVASIASVCGGDGVRVNHHAPTATPANSTCNPIDIK